MDITRAIKILLSFVKIWFKILATTDTGSEFIAGIESQVSLIHNLDFKEYKVVLKSNRKDIDINGHMHNLYYIDLAYEALPEEIYEKRPFNNVRVVYKKEIKLKETINCYYSFESNKHIITIKNNDDTIIHAIIKLY